MLRISKEAKLRGDDVEELQKKPWMAHEDQLLSELISQYGMKNWSVIAQRFTDRTGKHCRERWYNHLNPDIKKGNWSAEDDEIIMSMHKELGNQWAKITKCLKGRTDNAVKNRYHAILRAIRKRNRKLGLVDASSAADASDTSCGESDTESSGMVITTSTSAGTNIKCESSTAAAVKGESLPRPPIPTFHGLFPGSSRNEGSFGSNYTSISNNSNVGYDCNYASESSSSSSSNNNMAINSNNNQTRYNIKNMQNNNNSPKFQTPNIVPPNFIAAGSVNNMTIDNMQAMQETPRSSLDSWDSSLQGQFFDLDFDSIVDWDFVEADQSSMPQSGNNMQSRNGNMMLEKISTGCGAFMQSFVATETEAGIDPNVCSSMMGSIFGQSGNNHQQERIPNNNNYSNYGNHSNFSFPRDI